MNLLYGNTQTVIIHRAQHMHLTFIYWYTCQATCPLRNSH